MLGGWKHKEETPLTPKSVYGDDVVSDSGLGLRLEGVERGGNILNGLKDFTEMCSGSEAGSY